MGAIPSDIDAVARYVQALGGNSPPVTDVGVELGHMLTDLLGALG